MQSEPETERQKKKKKKKKLSLQREKEAIQEEQKHATWSNKNNTEKKVKTGCLLSSFKLWLLFDWLIE